MALAREIVTLNFPIQTIPGQIKDTLLNISTVSRIHTIYVGM